MLGLIFFIAIINIVGSQVVFFGGCPKLTPVEDFEPSKYLGKWYEVERYFALFEFGGKCVTADYSLNDNGTITVDNQQISAITGMHSEIKGLANLIGTSNEAKLSVIFPSLPIQFAAPYWVIGTDYDNYAVVWSCVSFGLISTRNAWILTRTPMPTIETIQRAYDILNNKGISRTFFIKTQQKNCLKSTATVA